MIRRVISGGQIGADQGGLDGAQEFWGLDTDRVGGFCPAGRRSEDGPIPSRYPLTEMDEWSYPPRTKMNIQASDGTVIFTHGEPSGGSKLTVKLADELCKPFMHVDLSVLLPEEAVDGIADWADCMGIEILNVAGSRESSCEGIQEWVARVIHDVLVEVGEP